MRRVCWWPIALAGLATAEVARADGAGTPAAEAIHVDFAAPKGCPAEADFVAGVLGRTSRARRALAGEAARTFVVRVAAGAHEATGHLAVTAPDGAEAERDVAGDTCEEVVAALALMAALSIDPNASPTSGSAGTTPSASGAETLPSASAAAAAAPSPPEAPPGAAGSAAPLGAASPVAREAPSAGGRRGGWRFGASAGVSLAAGVAPAALVGVPVAIHAVGPRDAILAPSFHLAFERTSSGTVDVPGGAASFTWTVAVLDACPHRWTWGTVDVAPCLRFEGGALQGTGSRIVPAREDSRAWLALGAVGRGEWAFAGPFFLGVEAGLRAPFVRTTYFFEPDTTIYRAPAVGAMAGAAVGASFL